MEKVTGAASRHTRATLDLASGSLLDVWFQLKTPPYILIGLEPISSAEWCGCSIP